MQNANTLNFHLKKVFIISLKASIFATIIFTLLNYFGHNVSSDRIFNVINEANIQSQLSQHENLNNNLFNECAMFQMEMDRFSSALKDIFATKFSMLTGHPCDSVRQILAGEVRSTSSDYTARYFYGARHIFSILSSKLTIPDIRKVYSFLSFLAPLLLLVSFAKKSRKHMILFSPLVLSMWLGFNLGNMSGNIAHAPGFFVSIIGISLLVYFHKHLLDRTLRLYAYALVASFAAYFDIMIGLLPFSLAMVILVNHFVFNDQTNLKNPTRHNSAWFIDIIAISLLFILVYFFLIIIKLLVVKILFTDYNLLHYLDTLQYRMSSEDISNESRFTVFKVLWDNKEIYFYNSYFAASFYYISSLLAWLFVLYRSITFWVKYSSIPNLKELTIFSYCSALVLIWYLIFFNHTVVHYQFMGKIAIIPASLGFMALIFIEKKFNFFCLISILVLLISILIASFPNSYYKKPSFLKNDKIDFGSCLDERGRTIDRIADNIFSFEIKRSFYPEYITNVAIFRYHPFGVWNSHKKGTFPLQILDSDFRHLESKHIKLGDRLVITYCSDGYDGEDSIFRLVISLKNHGVVDGPIFKVP